MTLAVLVLACLAVALVAALAVKGQRLPGWSGALLALVAPLGAWLFLQLASEPARSPLQFEVLGQYHRLSDTVRLSRSGDADVVLAAEGAADAVVAVSFVAGTSQLAVDVTRSSVPVLLGERPVNAVALGRRTVLQSAAGDSIIITRPWICLGCETRYVERGATRTEVRLGSAPAVAVGADTVRIFRSGRTAYAAADPAAGVLVGGRAIPSSLTAPPDSLFVGWPNGERLFVRPVAAQHRLDILLGSAARASWVLPQSDEDTLRLFVSANAGAPIPGTMPVLNPAAVAPGAAREPYGGMLAQRDDGWSYSANGVTRAFPTDEPQLLPGGGAERAAGHIVQIRHYDMDPSRARAAVIAAWLLGALLLGWLWRDLHPHAAASRVALAGAIYTLVAVRGALAFRVWLAPPHNADSPQTLLALLLAIPALTAVLHLWRRAADSPRMALRREAAFTAAPFALAVVAVGFMVLPAWLPSIFTTVAATVIGGAGGIWLLDRMLLGRADAGVRVREPLAASAAPALAGYTYRQFLFALVVLAMLGFLLVVTMQLLRYGTLLAFVAWGLILGAALLLVPDPAVLIQRRTSVRPLLAAAVAGVASAAVAYGLRLGLPITLAALLIGGAVAWLLVAHAAFRIRPVRLRALLATPLLIAVFASLAAVLLPGWIAATRVTAEYALALAGLIAITRIFSILWFRNTQGLSRRARGAQARTPLPRGALGMVLLLLVAAVYVPLGVFDPGLVLLFLAATVAAMALGFHTMGARATAVLVPAVVLFVFFAGMFVRPSSLSDGTASLSTAETRYAATYHPRELQQHMLTSAHSRPLTTVRTLQQYWGIGHFAAGGTTGRGYFGAAYADWIVPRPVALTENVFSTFLLSEHGWVGGAAVLLCYLAIALALLYGALRTGDRAQTAPRALLLVGLAAFWMVPALYIAAANGLLLPLTGQNMPMLGLLSRADVALACWLAAIGLCALPIAGSGGMEHVPSAGWAGRLRAGTFAAAGVFTTATIALIALLWHPTHEPVGDFALDGVIEGVEALVEQGVFQVIRTDAGDSIAIAATAAAHPFLVPDGFVRARVDQSNRMARGEPGGAGCISSDALLRARADGTIAVFNALCGIRAVTRTSHSWTGSLVTAARAPEFVLSDGRVAIVLDPLQPDEAVLGACTPGGTLRARAIRIGCTADAPVLRFGTSAPILESVGAGIELNGDAAAAPTLIRHGDHLRVAGGADAWALELPRNALAYARWENDASHRIAPPHGTPWLAQVDTQLARGMADAARAGWDVEVTLRPALSATLEARLARACAIVPRVRRCSALIADPVTGDILALASTSTQPHRYLPADPNLRNHPAASAIKPILAAAALHAYPELSTLEVEHAAAEYDVIANTAVQPSLRAPRTYPSARIPLRGYIGASDNLYSATLGFLATSARGSDGRLALRGREDQSGLVVNGKPLHGQPSWSGSGSLDLADSPLAAALEELYGVHVQSRDVPPFERAFWDAAIDAGALVPSTDLQRITPEPVALAMDAFRSPRELTSFSIGGDRNRWNNVALVEAISRIYTGRAVRLHLLRAVGPNALEYPAPDIPAFTARRDVLDGMAAVTQERWGTAFALRDAFAPNLVWRAKTGTLDEREWVGSLFLFAGGPTQPGGSAAREGAAPACPGAGVVTVELESDGRPDGVATRVFQEAVAPLLRAALGWDGRPCIQEGTS